jgi:hypothetical protein
MAKPIARVTAKNITTKERVPVMAVFKNDNGFYTVDFRSKDSDDNWVKGVSITYENGVTVPLLEGGKRVCYTDLHLPEGVELIQGASEDF